MSKIEKADSLSSVASFFRVSEGEVLSKGQYLVTDLGSGGKVVSQADYSVLRRFLFPLCPELKPLSLGTLKKQLLSMHDNERVVDAFLSASKSIVKEPITGASYVWTKEVKSEFYDYVKSSMKGDELSFTTLETLTGIPKSKLYTVAMHFNLKRDMDAEHLPSETFATLLLFLSRFELVSDSNLASQVASVSPKSVIKVRFVGTFVEKSLLSYLSSTEQSVVTELGGEEFIELDKVLSYLDSKGQRIPRRTGGRLTALVRLKAVLKDNVYYVSKKLLDEAIEYNTGRRWTSFGEKFALSSGLLDREVYSNYLNRGQFIDILDELEKSGITSKSLKKHLLSVLDSESVVPHVQLFSKEQVADVLTQHIFGLPVDRDVKSYVSVRFLLEFLNSTKEDYKLPVFLEKSNSGEYALGSHGFGLVESVSYSVFITHIRNLDAQLYVDYSAWLRDKFASRVEQVNALVRGCDE